jgi:hypothetical protein
MESEKRASGPCVTSGLEPRFWSESDKDVKRASSSLLPSTLAGLSCSASYTKTPTQERIGGTCKPNLVYSIEQFFLSFTSLLGSLVSGYFGSRFNPGSGAGFSSPSSNLKQSVLVLPSALKEHAPPSLLLYLPNINTPLKLVPYFARCFFFASCAGRFNVRSRYSLPEDDLEQNHSQDTQGDAYTYTDPEATTLTIGEIILLEALDFDHTRPRTGPGNGRAWIGDVGNMFVAHGNPDSWLSSRKVGIAEGKGREVAAVNTED